MANSQINEKNIVVHVVPGLALGGIENLCLELMRHSPPNVENILLNLNPQRTEMMPLFEQLTDLTICNLSLSDYKRLEFVRQLTLKFKHLRPEALLIYPFGLHILVGLAARLSGVSKIAVHAGNPPPKERSVIRNKWKLLILISRILGIPIYSCSEAVHQSFQNLARLPRGSFPIPNGCDVVEISRRAKQSRENRAESSNQIIGMVARLNSIKDHETLIKAFATVHSHQPNTELWIIGDGEKRQSLEYLTETLNLREAVIFWGDRSDIPELLGQMNIYAFSTTQDEGFGIALIEAMAASLPVVASDIPACREVLRNGEAGLLVPYNNPIIMAEILEKLLISDSERRYWSQKAYIHVSSHYTIQKCAEQWYRVLLEQ